MTKAVIFDLGGVLIADPAPKMAEYYVKYFGVNLSDFHKAFVPYGLDWQEGKMTEHLLWKNVMTVLGIKRKLPRSLWLDGFLSAYKEHKEVWNFITNLKKRSCKIGLLSNTEVPVMNFIKSVEKYQFDANIYSCEVGLSKPESGIYHLAIKKLGVKPEEIVFVDDKQENVEGAKKVGMKGVLFEEVEEVRREIGKILNLKF
jgi:putative hydrolase of the HAD superfamily